MKLLFLFCSSFLATVYAIDWCGQELCDYCWDKGDIAPSFIPEGGNSEDKWRACKAACEARNDCTIWFYRRDQSKCYLKNDHAEGNNGLFDGEKRSECWSGKVHCHDTQTIRVTKIEPYGTATVKSDKDMKLAICIAPGEHVTSTLTFQYDQAHSFHRDESITVGASAAFEMKQSVIFESAKETFTVNIDGTYSQGDSWTTTEQIGQNIQDEWKPMNFNQVGVTSAKEYVFEQPVYLHFKSCSGNDRTIAGALTGSFVTGFSSVHHELCIKDGKALDCVADKEGQGCVGGAADAMEYLQCDNNCNFDGKVDTCRNRVLFVQTQNNHDVVAAIDQVNKDCVTQCSCNYASWPPLASGSKTEL